MRVSRRTKFRVRVDRVQGIPWVAASKDQEGNVEVRRDIFDQRGCWSISDRVEKGFWGPDDWMCHGGLEKGSCPCLESIYKPQCGDSAGFFGEQTLLVFMESADVRAL